MPTQKDKQQRPRGTGRGKLKTVFLSTIRDTNSPSGKPPSLGSPQPSFLEEGIGRTSLRGAESDEAISRFTLGNSGKEFSHRNGKPLQRDCFVAALLAMTGAGFLAVPRLAKDRRSRVTSRRPRSYGERASAIYEIVSNIRRRTLEAIDALRHDGSSITGEFIRQRPSATATRQSALPAINRLPAHPF